MKTVTDSNLTASNPTPRRTLVTVADQQAALILRRAGASAQDSPRSLRR
jgi:hypothetical protein